MITIESYLDSLVVFWVVKTALDLLFSYRVLDNPRGDGDTIKVRRWFIKYTIRLANIDAPEKNQPGGFESRTVINLLLPTGCSVRLETYGKGNRGRVVASIFKRGVDVNREMVLLGQAMVYDDYCYDLVDYKTLEGLARSSKKGIWRLNNPVHPSKWRKGERGDEVLPVC